MKELLKAEWYKMWRNRLFIILLLIIAVQAGIQIYIADFVANNPIAASQEADLAEMYNFPLTGQNGVKMVSTALLPLAICLVAFVGLLIASEFQNNTIRAALALGKKRASVYFSKLFAAIAVTVIFIVLTTIITTLGLTIMFGFGNMSITDYLAQLFSTLIFQILQFSTFASVFCLIAFLSRSTGTTIIVSAAYVLITSILMSFLASFDVLLPLLWGLPSFFISASNELSGVATFTAGGAVVGLAYIGLSSLIGLFAFRKIDVK